MDNEDGKGAYTPLRSEGAIRREREHKRRMQRIIPLLIFGAVALLIAREEIPAVDGWISRLVDADAWRAGEACREAVLASLEQPGYARLLDGGNVEKTAAGYYVGGVEYALLQPPGTEVRREYSCNVNPAGKVVALGRDDG